MDGTMPVLIKGGPFYRQYTSTCQQYEIQAHILFSLYKASYPRKYLKRWLMYDAGNIYYLHVNLMEHFVH